MRRQKAFTLVEVLIVVLILGITAKVAVEAMANTEATMRANRAAREALSALRFARAMAITTGGVYGVEFDTANKRFQVFKTSGANVVKQSLTASGNYVINLTQPELNGTTMTCTITGDVTNPYDIIFQPLGNTSNNGTVVFTYAGYTSTVTIPVVGDPTIN